MISDEEFEEDVQKFKEWGVSERAVAGMRRIREDQKRWTLIAAIDPECLKTSGVSPKTQF